MSDSHQDIRDELMFAKPGYALDVSAEAIAALLADRDRLAAAPQAAAVEPAAQSDAMRKVLRIIEMYADSYATMTRIATREGREGTVQTRSVEVDLRKNVLRQVAAALAAQPPAPKAEETK